MRSPSETVPRLRVAHGTQPGHPTGAIRTAPGAACSEVRDGGVRQHHFTPPPERPSMRSDIAPGGTFPYYELPDHTYVPASSASCSARIL